jgi:hypothetical protein
LESTFTPSKRVEPSVPVTATFSYRSELKSFRKALQTLVKIGFTLEAGDEPIVKLDAALVKGILRARAAVRAERPGASVDLCTQVVGMDFHEAWEAHRQFVMEGVTLRVGALQDLVKSKQLTDRPKDRLFLEIHREMIEALLRKSARQA